MIFNTLFRSYLGERHLYDVMQTSKELKEIFSITANVEQMQGQSRLKVLPFLGGLCLFICKTKTVGSFAVKSLLETLCFLGCIIESQNPATEEQQKHSALEVHLSQLDGIGNFVKDFRASR